MAYLYVPELDVLISGCELLLEETTAWCVMSSGKPSQRPLSWRGWRTRPWIKRLSGTILRPSMAAHGVASWMSSLRDCRANLTASPANERATMTSEPCGLSSSVSSGKSSQQSFSSKTSQHSCASTDLFGPSYPAWVSSTRRHCYTPLTRGAQFRNGDVYLYSLPTVIASDEVKGNKTYKRGNQSLQGLVLSLPGQTARDWKDTATKAGQRQLPDRVNKLPAPTAMDSRSSGAAGYSTEGGRHSGTTLTDAVTGAASAGRTGKLNPRLSEWIMGLPIGWSSSEPLAMESFRKWQQRHGLS